MIVGAGPAGTVAATILARAGAHVRLIDRTIFPRDKLCGGTVDAGTLARLRAARLAAPITNRRPPDRTGCTSPGTSDGDRRQLPGRGVWPRPDSRDLDSALLQQAVAGGTSSATTTFARPIVDTAPARRRSATSWSRSTAATVGPARARRWPPTGGGRRWRWRSGWPATGRPRRWAVGAYFEHVGGMRRLERCTSGPIATSARAAPRRPGQRLRREPRERATPLHHPAALLARRWPATASARQFAGARLAHRRGARPAGRRGRGPPCPACCSPATPPASSIR